ncbi:MAG: hypothetical protein OEX02_16055 [Cyclobacteriaceae bacterium]|nr:hypothetical protein [Cyclobacteriaceae bacterium]
MKILSTMKWFFSLLILTSSSLSGATPDKKMSEVSRVIEERFSVKPTDNFELINKYGDVIINTWDVDSVKINVEILAFGKDYSDARKTLERVFIDLDQTGSYLVAETTFDRSSSLFQEFFNTLSDDSRAMMSKGKIEVNYTVFMPSTLSLTLENKFGDVFLMELNGKAQISVLHGNLRTNNINSNSIIDAGFGDVRIKYLKSGRITLRAAEGDIQQVGIVELRSTGSDIDVRKAERIRMDSRSDRSIKIHQIEHLSGKGMFSKLTIEELGNTIDLTMDYGELMVRNVPFNFSEINITSRFSDIYLALNPLSYLNVEIEAREDKLMIPMAFDRLERYYIDEKRKEVRLTGNVGAPNNFSANLTVRSKNADVTIHFVDDANDGQSATK